ncbi:flavodoxin [Streptomyces sp. NPDC005485]|uniref:flavodoxin n=1 Tax=Streptomyces sp. NPDC005485 TaxID=3155591 RepID=UPI0033A1A5D7
MERRKMLGLITAATASFGGLLAVNERKSSDSGSLAIPVKRSPHPIKRGKGTLVVYFSKTGKNYPDLDIKVGNTAQIARFIHDRVDGDTFEIVPARPYPADYDQTVEQAQREESRSIFPATKSVMPDTDQYSTIFLGHPVWWGEQPMVVQTFMRDRDLSYGTIVPFVTHEGSGFGNSLDVLGQYYPKARVLDGFSARGTAVHTNPGNARREVNAWLEGLGF